MNNKGFYDVIVDDYAEDAHLCARIFNDRTCSVRIKKGDKLVHSCNDSSYVTAFISRAYNKMLESKKSSQFKISFDYKNNRLHFNVRKGGIILMSVSRRVLRADNTTEVVFDSKNDLFIHSGDSDIISKFDSMRETAMGLIQIINFNNSKLKLKA